MTAPVNTSVGGSAGDDFGANSWLVEEMYERYRDNPAAVSEQWQEFFSDYKPLGAPRADVTAEIVRPSASVATKSATQSGTKSATKSATKSITPTQPAPAPAAVVLTPSGEPEAIRGVGAAIAANMERSLAVPTATSMRQIPAKLLEVNRRVINGYRSRTGQTKVSFTHLIGYAVVRAMVDEVPNMKNAFVADADGKPQLQRHTNVNLGLAVDVDKGNGQRALVVPVLKGADTLDFLGFVLAYDDIVRKVRTNKLTIDDFQGANVSLTNPGTIGTNQSVPRLMVGQGVIVGVGSIDYPAEFQGSDERALNQLGVSKVVTITSTYDHRIIQGAESGLFLKYMNELLLGEHGFYEAIFRSLGVPYEAVKWRQDTNELDGVDLQAHKQMQVATLIRVHRVRGHLIADLDPLRWKAPRMPRELDPLTYGLTIWDLDREFATGGVGGVSRLTLGALLGVLRDAYCRTIGIEYMHIQNTDEQRWMQERVEGHGDDFVAEPMVILERLNAAEAFERFLATKYVGTKRFGLEGAESAVPIMDMILNLAADHGMDGAVIGMAHRGRLNVLANVVGKSLEHLFGEFEGHVDPHAVQGSGDVKYHLGTSGKFQARSGALLPIELASNPSHLETVDPIVLGTVRAMQDQIEPPGAFSVLPLLVHGDAAFAGQGVVAECLAMSDTSGYRVGGTIHLIINNQIGFTTSPEYAHSSQYCSDIAKSVGAPIFHVNGDDPEACVRVAKLAFEYRQRFHKDVVIDMVCYRRHGHNEGDDPSYTQPLMYKAIAERRSVRKLYLETLVKRADVSVEDAERVLADYQAKLQSALDDTRAHARETTKVPPPPKPLGVLPHVTTGVERAMLDQVFAALNRYPDDFTVHPKLLRQFETRREMYENDGDVDWATAEALAFGTLTLEGSPVRLAGEDCRRGTFSHRHAVLVDYLNETKYAPLANIAPGAAKFWVYDSLLSEYAALGFEYGYAHANPAALVMWEAQFGDFVNGAQVVIDQYLVAAEDKWGQHNGLVLLLPHGMEGQGPEHSSARLERFLQQCAEDNIQVAYPTTARQYFHLLRRQVRRDVRKPLVVMAPKQPLRMKESRSPISELTTGSFSEVLDDPFVADRSAVRRVVLCSGKVAWDAMAERTKRGAAVAIVRVEQLYPFPEAQISAVLATYPNAKEVLWLQEEPENMGAWHFVEHIIWRFKDHGYDLRHVSRVESGSPATGSKAVHDQELAELMDSTFVSW
ncbi:MAG: multifunctional oxoglutarate decarboxylase/oxoglutarate dehydrogenase thiamine pyrophosphate-binding subunit/dihydrolipoyllysine-residue succinyltransferase subunit [Ilumatobacteraceae bacterium]|nr:multifunctional oxoglutarate decarboxylase/oxoglutarate dehydrogenase thiamine pyrophosphate-binding subunit/dihydrolipoyllysine-residue succinyltransferase subunit [Ilumatobacteraceae bacterium]